MNLKPFCAIACVFLFLSHIFAQDKLNIKFGKITAADFDISMQKYDSGAAAVVIADIGSSSFEGNNKSGFSIIYNHFKRVKIVNKNGFDIATVEIPLYTNGKDEEKLQNLKAVTYNLENGKIEQTKLDDKSIFTDRAQKKLVIKKFTFPAVKEGSIIEFSYTQSSDFLFNLQPWEFQGEYPRLWSEYEVTIPEYFQYVTLSQGYQQFAIKTSKSLSEHYSVNINNGAERSESVALDGQAIDSRFVMKNVPALKEENFTTTLDNHIAKIEFQLSNIHYPNSAPQDIMGNWLKVNKSLLEEDDFGADLSKNNGWLTDDLKTITVGTTDKLEKAKKIYAFLRDHFTCTDHSRMYMNSNIKTAFKNKNGSDAEINLLLTAMLNHENINAYPVILSTRSHGKTNEIYPLMDRFNYVVCSTNINGTQYFLDACQPRLGFGRLPEYCYNGHARIVSKEPLPPIYLEADSLKEQKLTSVIIVADESVQSDLSGSFQSSLGYNESYELRERLANKTQNEFFKAIKSPLTSEFEIQNPGIDSLKQPDYPVTVHYDFSMKKFFTDDIIYFNPMLSETLKENPFKSAERKYPVEMSHTTDETYILHMEIPKGYEVEEMPKSAKVLFNNTEGYFEYLILKDDNNVQLRSRIKINRANFSADDYGPLRDFFGFIVKKQSEQIVFKKKK
ncbi:MAG TPA: DUF3857 domain-containing protein [Puia sp.]|jgi:hypothetical protein|nr:DUF3857 domain-containing protein [Puia sp.]